LAAPYREGHQKIGFPLASLMSSFQLFSISATTFCGIGT
jgi:hypothetical protein